MNPIVATIICNGAALFLLWWVGNFLCQQLLSLTGLKDATAASQSSLLKVGRVIGNLERTIIAVGLIAHSWEAIVAVIALKTIGRFKELDDKLPAEYFLVGSLFSVLWAMIVAGIWLFVDSAFGIHLAATLR